MLDKLIESKSNGGENRRLGGFLLTTAAGAFAVLTVALIYSLFAYNVALAGDNLNLSAIVAPVQIAEQAPPDKPAASVAPKQQAVKTSNDNVPTRRVDMLRVDEQPTKAPDTISVARNEQAARPDGHFKLDNTDSNLSASAGSYTNERGAGNGAGMRDGTSDPSNSGDENAAKTVVIPPPPPLIKHEPKPIVEQPKKVAVISGGVVNGRASNLVKPIYSAAARAVRAQGRVEVQVTIDEEGRVISANAVNGNPLLIPSAVSAARASKFTPTLLSNQKVKVTGIIVYNFNQM